MRNYDKFKTPAPKTSHSFWDDLLKEGSTVAGKWLDNEGKKIDANKELGVAEADAQAAALTSQLKAQEEEGTKRSAYVIGGTVLAVVLIIAIIMLFKK